MKEHHVFPTPHLDSSFYLRLRRHVVFRAEGKTMVVPPRQDQSDAYSIKIPVDMEYRPEREWLDETKPGEKEESGRWRQTWTFNSTMKLDLSPSFTSDMVDCAVRFGRTIPVEAR